MFELAVFGIRPHARPNTETAHTKGYRATVRALYIASANFFFFKLLRTTSPLSTGSLPDGGGVDGGGNGGTAAAADDGSKTQVSSSTE